MCYEAKVSLLYWQWLHICEAFAHGRWDLRIWSDHAPWCINNCTKFLPETNANTCVKYVICCAFFPYSCVSTWGLAESAGCTSLPWNQGWVFHVRFLGSHCQWRNHAMMKRLSWRNGPSYVLQILFPSCDCIPSLLLHTYCDCFPVFASTSSLPQELFINLM